MSNQETLILMTPENKYNSHLALIGNRISALRHSRGEKESTMANALGIPQSTLSEIENGKKDIRYTLLLDICAYLEVPFYELVRDIESVYKPNIVPGDKILHGTIKNNIK